MNTIIAALAATLLVFTAEASAQWMKHPDSSITRTPDGQPNLSAGAPKAADGKPDLSGVWLADNDPTGSRKNVENSLIPRYFANIAADLKPEEAQLHPWAEALFKQRLQNEGKDSPGARCHPTGMPQLDSIPLPYKIVQTPRLIMILYEENTVFRQIFLDGRAPVKDPEPRWMGYSTGKWDGDTLVVDTVGFNDRSWLDAMGHPHSDALHLIERFRRPDAGHLEVQVTIDDPKAYTKPLTYTVKTTLVHDEDLLEYFCSDNEKDVQHFK
ncbi:MAG TPA: hypothetical protein VE422_15445 [Terriglobia bacterium]|nr:hypothetical protein [Terriglobia bacterium]